MLTRSTYVLCVLAALCGVTQGLMCRVCSYSYNPDSPYDDTDCIYSPATFTGPSNEIHCNRTCITQENYSLEQKRITSYLRSCNQRADSGFCTKDTWSLVCFDSCISDYCNDFNVPLHEVYPTRDAQHGPDINYYENNNAVSHVRTFGSVSSFVLFGMVAALLCMS